MANYHFVYKDVEGASTQWDNIQRKLGNLPPKPPAFKPPSFKPATATATTTDDYNYLIQNQKMLSQDLPQLTMELNRLENIRSYAGAVEYKLFVGSLNKQATEKEVEEIFSPYGRVEDVYLMRDEMKQSRGCGFVKFSSREMAMAAINGLSGIYTMKGCDQPLTVRFADPKRPRAGESRGGPAFGGPGFGPRFQPPGLRPTTNLGEPMHGRIPPNAWHPMSPQNMGPSLNAGMQGFGSQLLPRSGDLAMPSTLQTVWASDNELTGSIPEFIGNWSKLKSLFLGNNKLTGILPAQKCTPLLNMIKDGNAERIGGSLTTG